VAVVPVEAVALNTLPPTAVLSSVGVQVNHSYSYIAISIRLAHALVAVIVVSLPLATL